MKLHLLLFNPTIKNSLFSDLGALDRLVKR
jgi:hypothetical protein